MYLCVLDKESGLIDLEYDRDGFYAIPEFRALLKTKNGLKSLTVVALVVDYESPIRNYSEKERPDKAMDVVFQNRKIIAWKSKELQEAAIAYEALQYNLDLDEKRMLDNMRRETQDKMSSSKTVEEKLNFMSQLNTIIGHINNFEKRNSGKDMYEDAPVRNGYKLSRLEQKLLNKKSFYYEHTEPEN